MTSTSPWADDLHLALEPQLDDLRSPAGRVPATGFGHHVVHRRENLLRDLVETQRRRIPGDVGRRAHQRLAKSPHQFAAERAAVALGSVRESQRDAYAHGPVFCDHVGGEVLGSRIDDGHGRVVHLHEVDCHRGDFTHIFRDHVEVRGQHYQGLCPRPVLYCENFLHGLFVAGVAAYAPDRVGGVEYDSAVAQHGHGLVDYLPDVHHKLSLSNNLPRFLQ